MSEETTQAKNPTVAPAPAKKQFDVALVDPSNPAIEHYPRVRVTVDADSAAVGGVNEAAGGVGDNSSAANLVAGKKPLITDSDRQQVIIVYNKIFGLTRSDLRYDIVPAMPSSSPPAMPEAWTKHLKAIGLA